jgi:hypothetical protein
VEKREKQKKVSNQEDVNTTDPERFEDLEKFIERKKTETKVLKKLLESLNTELTASKQANTTQGRKKT